MAGTPADLLVKARAGDDDAFRELVEPHRRELQVHCYRILGSFQDAEDTLQDTLLTAWQGLEAWPARLQEQAALLGLIRRSDPPCATPGPTSGMPPRRWSRGSWETVRCSFGQMLERARADVRIRPDLIGSATVGGGCLLEIGEERLGRWLEPGDRVALRVERLGELTSPVVDRPTEAP